MFLKFSSDFSASSSSISLLIDPRATLVFLGSSNKPKRLFRLSIETTEVVVYFLNATDKNSLTDIFT